MPSDHGLAPGARIVYIGHPLVGDGSPEWGDIDRNMERYLRFCAYACSFGYAVLTWAHHVHLHRGGMVRSADYWLRRDMALLAKADLFWCAGPVGVSNGLAAEADFAKTRGIPIICDPLWLDPAFDPMASSRELAGARLWPSRS